MRISCKRGRDEATGAIDETTLLALVRHALTLAWTRDPFDRMLAAHSSARRVPLCTVDRTILEHHVYVADEARPS
ncbi:MAG: hypothetical protein ACREK3_03075 [Gemmatimonadota bacterium]